MEQHTNREPPSSTEVPNRPDSDRSIINVKSTPPIQNAVSTQEPWSQVLQAQKQYRILRNRSKQQVRNQDSYTTACIVDVGNMKVIENHYRSSHGAKWEGLKEVV